MLQVPRGQRWHVKNVKYDSLDQVAYIVSTSICAKKLHILSLRAYVPRNSRPSLLLNRQYNRKKGAKYRYMLMLPIQRSLNNKYAIIRYTKTKNQCHNVFIQQPYSPAASICVQKPQSFPIDKIYIISIHTLRGKLHF